MVPLFEWNWTTMDPKSSSCLPMTGEDTGLEALASPLVGYLGKVQERVGSLENCPWCSSKGLTHALRSYRINLQESVTLCTNPQCLFPLVSRPLEDVLASLQPTVGSKRKIDVLPDNEESLKPLKKRLRLSRPDGHGLTGGTDIAVSAAEHKCADSDMNVQPAASQLRGKQSNGHALEENGRESLVGDSDPEQNLNSPSCVDTSAPHVCTEDIGQSSEALLVNGVNGTAVSSPHCSEASVEETDSKPRTHPSEAVGSSSNPCSANEKENPLDKDEETPVLVNAALPKSGTETLSAREAEDSVSVPEQLFWSNTDNLCWLNSLLTALVKCKSLREHRPQEEPEHSTVWKLMKDYEDICAAIQTHQHTDRDGVIRVSDHMLQKANEDLESVRLQIFQLLKPKLKCRLGQRGTPVFAMPPLLAMDSWAESHFQSAFVWEFVCSKCSYAKDERVTKTLPSVTNLVPDWHPLNAVHGAPCNKCRSRKQQRTMKLESLPSVFALHFVKGLPDNNVGVYTFHFNEERYCVTTVIQYKQQLRHFVTWTRNADGSWLEYDDLKHPVCQAHPKLPIPAQEIHVVFWEVAQSSEPRVCSPSSTFTESLPESKKVLSLQSLKAEGPHTCTPDQTLLTPQDSDVISALSLSDQSGVADATVTADASIGTTTLLDTFEGLTHSDIVTLTLVEFKSETKLQTSTHDPDESAPSRNEATDATPDSSSAALGSESGPSQDDELPTLSLSSESDSPDNSSSDPTFVPSVKRGRGAATGTAVRRLRARKAASDTTAAASVHLIEEMAAITELHAAKKKDTHREAELKALPISTTGSSPPSSAEKGPPVPSHPDYNDRWSYLLSRHAASRLAPIQRTSVTQAKPAAPLFSTPKPLKNPHVPAVSYSKKLRTEESDSLPLRAAEMYGAFGAKNSNPPKPVQPLTPNKPTNVTATSASSLNALGAKGVSPLTSIQKAATHSPKPSLGLNSTDALRYKLLKKLKAKKKKLAKLKMLLGDDGDANLRPDSTDLCSPSTVSSSTYDGSICDDFLSDLLSPATTASHLSPDSTEFLEMLASGQDGANGFNSAQTSVHVNVSDNEPNGENFLEEFLSQASAQKPTDMETEALNALELFI